MVSILRTSCVLLAAFLVAPSWATVCPESCYCNTRDGLHRATCSSLEQLYKFTLRQKHHNINVLDLSHNNITKLSHELDRLTEIVTLDLSTNGITELNKFLLNSKKLVHLNLASNRIRTLSLTHLPASVSSLDLTNNLLIDVPSNIEHLKSLEHLELEGNPLDCSCENIRIRDKLLIANVFIDKVKCSSPPKVKGQSWLELKTKDICKVPTSQPNFMDMMMGDQPINGVLVGEETSELKSKSVVSGLEDSEIIRGQTTSDDDDSLMFMRVQSTSAPQKDFEGSGEFESTTVGGIIEPEQVSKLNANSLATDEMLLAENVHSTDDPNEGSGEGSGFDIILPEEDHEQTTTPVLPELYLEPVVRLIEDDNNTTEYPLPKSPTLFEGGPNWLSHTTSPPVTEKAATPIVIPDTTVSQKVTKELESKSDDGENPSPHKTGTYICVAIIVVLLVGLIGFAIVKSQIRRRRDRRILRQQKRDVENASKEMVDMNKSLLGKPAIVDSPIEKKANGKYELVPTHESHQKKSDTSDILNGNGVKHPDVNGVSPRGNSPRDSNQNKSSSKDNNLSAGNPAAVQDTSFDSIRESHDSRKDSLSSEDIFVPINDDDTPRLNGNADSALSQPLLNGDGHTDSDYLSPSREYVPVYPPDMGRVRIKMSETAKPKTPVLVNRSRSNAGDIIITPSLDGNLVKSTT